MDGQRCVNTRGGKNISPFLLYVCIWDKCQSKDYIDAQRIETQVRLVAHPRST